MLQLPLRRAVLLMSVRIVGGEKAVRLLGDSGILVQGIGCVGGLAGLAASYRGLRS